MFRDLADYVKQYFPTGIPWNPNGQPAQEVLKSLSAGSAPASAPTAPAPAAAGAPPPPPPPPPPGPPPVLDIKTDDAPAPASSGGFGAVFSELNKGDAVTKGLRKVDKSEMTHKNPSLRSGSTVSSGQRGKSPAPGKKPKPESMRIKKPAKKELEGNKWTIVCSMCEKYCSMLLTFTRKTTRRRPSQLRLRPHLHTRFSSAVATTPPSLSGARPTRSQSRIPPVCP